MPRDFAGNGEIILPDGSSQFQGGQSVCGIWDVALTDHEIKANFRVEHVRLDRLIYVNGKRVNDESECSED